MPKGTQVVSAESWGVSAWFRIAKVSVLHLDSNPKRYFLKCATGKGARASTEGEFYSATAIEVAAPGLVPKPVGWGQYVADGSEVSFFLGEFHDINLLDAPNPIDFTSQIAQMHGGSSPNGMFGFDVPTAIGMIERTVRWEQSWAKSFTVHLKDVVRYDNETNGCKPSYGATLKQLIDVVIPRLLGVLQSEGRRIVPALIHGDLWEQNVGTDKKSGQLVVFDAGCIYAHNEMEFGTWRCAWASHFKSPVYKGFYQRFIEPSEPVDEWDDRNRLYSIYASLVDSAGHPGSHSREIAYNDMLYLCERYSPSETLDKYDSGKENALTGINIPHLLNHLD